MKTLILNGSPENDPMGVQVSGALQTALETRGWDSETVLLREKKIGPCAGDFFCWTRTPGVCNLNDDNREIAAKMVQCDLLIYLTPVTFGGYSSDLKRMVDHLIQNISPFFTRLYGETHHKKRYPSYPKVLCIGWLPQPDTTPESIFRHLIYRNSLNMYARPAVCGIGYANQQEDKWTAAINGWLDQASQTATASAPVPVLPKMEPSAAEQAPVHRALLLVGSPRLQKSVSNTLGTYLMEQMTQRGVETETVYLYTSMNSPEKMENLFAALDSADLVALAFPLYVDSLPGPVIAVLEKIARHNAEKPAHPRFTAITNCGFPEAYHNLNALAVCAQFAHTAGFAWMGGLTIGGGGMVRAEPLKDQGGPANPIKHSLEAAAEALASGLPIPETAHQWLGKLKIPGWLYRFFGDTGWKQEAKKNGVQNQLNAQPYLKNRS